MKTINCPNCHKEIYLYKIKKNDSKNLEQAKKLGGNIILKCPHCPKQFSEDELWML